MKRLFFLCLSFIIFSHSLAEDFNLEEEIVSVALDFIPIVGNVKGLQEAITGKDMITGKNLTTNERILALFSAIPTGDYMKNGKHLKNGQKFLKAAERAKKAGKLKNFISFSKAASRAMKKAKALEKVVKNGIKVAKFVKHFPKKNLRKFNISNIF